MNNKKNEAALWSLQIFLVKRFLIVMVFIYISGQITGFLYRNVFMNLIREVMQVGQIGDSTDVIGSLGQLLLVTAGNLFRNHVPILIQPIYNKAMSGMFGNVHVPGFITRYGSGMVRAYLLALIVLTVLQLLITILPYAAGGWWYCRCISTKMEELRRLDAERVRREEEQRNLLFSDIVHDIKTPITTIVGYSRALNDGIIQDETKRHDYLNSIYAKSMRISELITMLFEFVKLDSAGFTLHRENADLAELLRETVITLFTDFEDKGLEVDFDITDEVCMASIDRVQMGRVITNLLTNAIRYSKSGDKAFISMEKVEREMPYYLISVADSGLAISKEFAEHIFEPFSRSDEARQTTSGGSGLGLSIAHKVAEMHGGELRLNLDYGNGYTKAFQILVPVLDEKTDNEK